MRPRKFNSTDTLFPYTTLFRSAATRYSRCCPCFAGLSPPDFRKRPVHNGTQNFHNFEGAVPCRQGGLAASGYFRERRRFHFFPPPHVLHGRSEEHTSALQSLMRISYAV